MIKTSYDKNVVYVDKKLLENYPEQDLDFIKQILLVVTDPKAKIDIMK